MKKRLRTESLWHGLAYAIINDGEIDNDEIKLLHDLLSQREDDNNAALNDLKALIDQICRDNLVTSAERARLLRFLRGFVNRLTPSEKGNAFEEYIIRCFTKTEYRLIEWRSDKHIPKGMFPASNQWPDIVMERKETRKRIAIECKYRSRPMKGQVTWAKSAHQIYNYRDYQRREKIPVYIAIGLGGTPDDPKALYIARLRSLKDPVISLHHLDRFLMTSDTIVLDPD